MLTVNVDLEDRLVNGQLGTAKDAFASRNLWAPIEKAETNIRIRTNKDFSLAVTRTQFQLMLACGCMAHKVQGLTLEEIVISFDLIKQDNFHYGQMYVALSRVTSLNSLYLIGELNLL